jgi:hypothetical protein
MPNSNQFAAQLAQVFAKATMEGLWMTVVFFWNLFILAWPVWIVLGLGLVAANRLAR